MAKALPSKLRWVRLRDGVTVTCYAEGCTNLARVYCKNGTCRQPHCDAHKAEHVLKAHTIPKLAKIAGDVRFKGFDELAVERKIEILALVSKLRRRREVEQCDVGIAGGSYVAWAVVQGNLIEKRSDRIEQALHDLLVELRAQANLRRRPPQGRPSMVS